MCRNFSYRGVVSFVSIFRDKGRKVLTKLEYRLKSQNSCKNERGVYRNWFQCISLMFYLLLCFQALYADIGAEWNPTGNPIGGGPGYSDSVRHQDADYIVSTKTELLNALSSASNGDIVYVVDSAEINMNGSVGVIPAGVTLASGRGRTLGDTISWGALIYYDKVDCDPWEMFRPASDAGGNGKRVRITGFRFRGSYSDLEGRNPNDSFDMDNAEAAIKLHKDSCIVDNCEFWGFGYAPIYVTDGDGSYIHHNYFHHGSHVYKGYGFNASLHGEVLLEANYWDFHVMHIAGGGTNSIESRYEARYNIMGSHAYGNVIDRHGSGTSPPQAAADYVHHNTIRYNGYVSGNVSGYWLRGVAVDSVLVHNNWFWDVDSAHSINLYDDTLCRIWDNHFTENPPPGISGKLPVANIIASADSGSAPLTVTFKPTGSYDPDGNLRAFYWNFGDSSGIHNYRRTTDINDSVQHTFNDIGVYHVELMVTDDDGIPSFDYVDINVAPNNTRNYLCCWIKDRFHNKQKGYFSKQILINDWVAWERDIAGDGSWEHVVLDITDSISGRDSILVTFRLYCERDSSYFGERGRAIMYIDDVVLYGAELVNGGFESSIWSGTSKRTDGKWIPDKKGAGYYCWEWCADVHSGLHSYILHNSWVDPIYAGEWAQVSQKIKVTALGINDSRSNDSDKVYDLYFPSPNPSLTGTNISYQLPTQSDVQMKIYDISGRLVKTLVDETKGPGIYSINWDGQDERGLKVSSGVYFYRFNAEPAEGGMGFTATRKLVVLKK